MAAFGVRQTKSARASRSAVPIEPCIASIVGIDAILDPTGALYWPAQDTLVVSDLHLETGSSYARTGQMLPPYDTAETLARLTQAIARYTPARVISLGDSFHDRGGPERLSATDRAALDKLTNAAEFVWVTGNHDGDCVRTFLGTVCEEFALDGVLFRHIPSEGAVKGREVAGHLHPAARLVLKGRAIRRRCFVGCSRRLVMPAFGAYTGGLNVADPAFAALWPDGPPPTLHLLGESRVYSL